MVNADNVIVGGRRVRHFNVDTEESVHPDPTTNTVLGKMTSEAVKKEISGKTADLECYGKDIYSRRFCYIFINGQNNNVKLVRQGLSSY